MRFNSLFPAGLLTRLWLSGLVLLAGVSLTGCQSSGGRPFMPDAVENPGNARAFVYWPGQRWREKAGQVPEVQIDGVAVGLLRYKTYLPLELPAGRREFRLTGLSEAANWDVVDKAFALVLDPGETVYVRLLVQYDQKSNNLLDGLMKYTVLFLPRSASQARMEMSGLKAAPGGD